MATTLKDIARECGLAVSTVSNILNNNATSFASEAVRKKVRETAERLGYKRDYLSSSLRTRRTRSIGLILDQIDDLTRQDFLVPFAEAFSERGYEVALAEHRNNASRALTALEGFAERLKEGVVIFSDLLGQPVSEQERLKTAVARSPLKILAVGTLLKGIVPSMDIDRGHAVEQSLKHFEDGGHRRILVVYEHPWDMRPAFSSWNRPGVTYWSGIHEFSDFLTRLDTDGLGENTALFFRTDRIAIPALNELRARGIRIPDDVEVLSFDNFPFSQHTQPAISTWDIGFHRLGNRAQELLWSWTTGTEPDREAHEVFHAQFIARNSHRGTL